MGAGTDGEGVSVAREDDPERLLLGAVGRCQIATKDLHDAARVAEAAKCATELRAVMAASLNEYEVDMGELRELADRWGSTDG